MQGMRKQWAGQSHCTAWAPAPYRSKTLVVPLGADVDTHDAMNHRETLEPKTDGDGGRGARGEGGVGGRGDGGTGDGGLGDAGAGDGGLGGGLCAGGAGLRP